MYCKAQRRKAQAVSLVSVGVQVVPDDGRIGDARITLGAVAPTVIRARAAEDALRGEEITANLCRRAADLAAGESRPISDIRASAEYRRRLVAIWVRRALESFIG